MSSRTQRLVHCALVLMLAAAATWLTGPAVPAGRDRSAADGRRRLARPPRHAPPRAPVNDPIEPAPGARAAVAAFRAVGAHLTIATDGEVRTIDFTGCAIKDDDLRHLEATPRLTLLNLDGTRVSDDGLQHIRNLPELSFLRLCRTPITDAGLQRLGDLPRLSYLILDDTAITDAGIAHLIRFPALGAINAMGCPVTGRAQELIQEHLPKCRVKR